MNYYLSVLKKYAVFEGRASRAEYWYFVLFNYLAMFALASIDGFLGFSKSSEQSLLVQIYTFAVLIPSIGLIIRRMHDVNKSGWYALIPIYNLVLALTTGTVGKNKYGKKPAR